MGNYAAIPIIALFCYLFLMIAFMSAKKTRLINSFLIVLSALVLWTGGSFCMRMLFFPSIKFWYDVSILGLTLMPYAFFIFISEFVGSKEVLFRRIWILLIAAINIVNISTGALLAHPELVLSGREYRFIYNPTWTVVIMFGVCGIIVIHLLYILIKNSRDNELLRRQFTPIVIGILILFSGNILIMFPFFNGFPLDILAGVFNAFFMLYALYKRRLFKLTLLVSRGICYFITIGLAILIFYNTIPEMQGYIASRITSKSEFQVLIIVILFSLVILLVYNAIKKFIDTVFIKEDITRAENLRMFSASVSKSLRIEEILEELVSVIQNSIRSKKVYVFVLDSTVGEYKIAHSTSSLDQITLAIKYDNPMVLWLKNHDECLMMKEFKRAIEYKSLWETEKKQLAELETECIAPLKYENELIGIILLTEKAKNSGYTYDDITFLESINTIGAIAVKNSRLYEKVYMEARTDELTGLINRKYFYETLQEEYDKHKNSSLALIILNIDDFKLYNQLYGNKEGDIALKNIARIIKTAVGQKGIVARYSGKEFAIILPFYDMLSAKNLAENIRKQILNMNKKAKDYPLKALTVSGGICVIPHSARTVKQLVDNADMAVYHAKRRGKNLILAYSIEKKDLESEVNSFVEEKKVDIYSEYAPTIFALTAAIDAKDHYTFKHSKRVAYYATRLAYAYGMDEDFVRIIKEAALLHDIGKIGVPEHILNKPGKLNEEEYEKIKGHVENSIGIIRHLPSLDYVIPAVIGHHERYDGKGYPRGIAGEDIPISARMLCIADAFDAITTERTYKQPSTALEALEILEANAGRQFDSVLVPIFVQLVKNGLINIDEESIKMYE
jgi:diguanylate cyclase (GGDEF)-like protein/putative nucleotidyltransferase with HDIG domain